MSHRFFAAAQSLLTQLADTVHRHPKRVAASVGTLLLCGGGGAFAVASYGPDASDLPVRQISQQVEPAAFAAVDGADTGDMRLYRTETTRSSDSAESLLQRLGISDPSAVAFLRGDGKVRQAVLGRVGRLVSAEATADHGLLKLTARWSTDDSDQFQRLVVEKTAQGFTSRVESAPTTVSARLASGSISSSLLAATDSANIPENVATQVAEIFSSQIDFRRHLRKGDRFAVVYETVEADGEVLRAGRVLSAEFVNNGKALQAMWYQPAGASKGAYFTLDGKGLNHAYLSAPLEFTRVSSGFSNRFHPILKEWRMHLGTDFAAPTGTPVRTVGDGVVEFAGQQNGYGNVIFVHHRSDDVTVYAHLSQINVTKGQKVSQGDTIGLVGQTGWATGPHLHFEFRVNGVQQDPQVMAQQSESSELAKADRAKFDRLAGTMRLQLETANQTALANAD